MGICEVVGFADAEGGACIICRLYTNISCFVILAGDFTKLIMGTCLREKSLRPYCFPLSRKADLVLYAYRAIFCYPRPKCI
jgi:hypothetical protein